MIATKLYSDNFAVMCSS